MTDQRIDFGVEFEHRGPKLKYNSATVKQMISDGNALVEPNYIALDTTNHTNSCWIYDTAMNELVQLYGVAI